MLRAEIKKNILKAVGAKFKAVTAPEFSLETPENDIHGDYAANIALVLAKVLKKNPGEIAAALVEELNNNRMFKKVEFAPPGFINFWLADNILYAELGEILKKKNNYGKPVEKKAAVNIEFISANPTGPLTIGNGRGAFWGEALARILVFAGYQVTREYYINDARASNQIQELGKTILGRGTAYPGPYTDEIRKRLQNKYYSFVKMSEEEAGHLAAREIQKDSKKFIETKLKIKFDVWYSEEKLYKDRLVKKVLDELNARGFIYEKDSALWFKASRFGDSEDRVAMRTGGTPTYFLPDVAYHADKLTKRKFAEVIDVLGADHHGTFPRVLAGLRALGIDEKRVQAIFVQMVRLKKGGEEVKMSKRSGEFVTLKELIEEVGLDAARYFFLEKSPSTHLDFDLDLAKERSLKNPVYYIQYAHARMASIFRKAQDAKRKTKNINYGLLKENEELGLIKKLIQLPEIIEDTAHDYEIIRLTRYALELSKIFHNFYEKHRVITENKDLTEVRLALVKATQIVLEILLDLIGVSAPEKM